MRKLNEVVRTFLIALSVTLIMQLGGFADLRKWLVILSLTLIVTALSMALSYAVGASAFNKNEAKTQ